MDHKKEAKKYFNKYFRYLFINENDDEFKAFVKLLKKVTTSDEDNNLLQSQVNKLKKELEKTRQTIKELTAILNEKNKNR